MRVLISGGTGMIGSALTESLIADKHEVFVLTRSPGNRNLPAGSQVLVWDGKTARGWGVMMEQMDAVVNLVGERLSNFPWTRARKQRFLESRVNGGRAITTAIRQAAKRPKVLIQASGINYYGFHGKERITEADPSGYDFLAKLSAAWEASTAEVEALGVRRAVIRSGVVMNAVDGILPLMALPVKLFVGGKLGNGQQGLPWITLEDEVRAVRFLLERVDLNGSFNLVAPEPISSQDFMRTLARVMRRPFWLPAPAFLLRLALGEMSTLVLEGMYALPKRLVEAGFQFKFATAEAALQDLLRKEAKH